MVTSDGIGGHVFISHVREDEKRVDRLEDVLTKAGIPVWRDVHRIRPGQDWKIEIQRAIREGALAFIACFSHNSEQKDASYQREELILAVEQIRRRPPGKVWFIPVRFDDCALPHFEIGPGRTISDLNRVDLIDESWSRGPALAVAVLEVIGSPRIAAATGRPEITTMTAFTSQIGDRSKGLQVEAFVDQVVATVSDRLTDRAAYPDIVDRRFNEYDQSVALVPRVERIVADVEPLIDVALYGAAYAGTWHTGLWRQTVERLEAYTMSVEYHDVELNYLRRLPVCLVLNAAAVGAAHRGNWPIFTSVMLDARTREFRGVLPRMLAHANPWNPFVNAHIVLDHLLDHVRPVRDGKLDYDALAVHKLLLAPELLATVLRPRFQEVFDASATEFRSAFYRSEAFIGLERWYQHTVSGSELHEYYRPWVPRLMRPQGAAGGALTTRVLLDEREAFGAKWPPFAAGLLGGGTDDETVRQVFADYDNYVERYNDNSRR